MLIKFTSPENSLQIHGVLIGSLTRAPTVHNYWDGCNYSAHLPLDLPILTCSIDGLIKFSIDVEYQNSIIPFIKIDHCQDAIISNGDEVSDWVKEFTFI